MIENLVGQIDCAEINESNKEAFRELINFENSINPYMLNPGYPVNIERVKTSYMKYLSVKKRSVIPVSFEMAEKELVESVGGILK